MMPNPVSVLEEHLATLVAQRKELDGQIAAFEQAIEMIVGLPDEQLVPALPAAPVETPQTPPELADTEEKPQEPPVSATPPAQPASRPRRGGRQRTVIPPGQTVPEGIHADPELVEVFNTQRSRRAACMEIARLRGQVNINTATASMMESNKAKPDQDWAASRRSVLAVLSGPNGAGWTRVGLGLYEHEDYPPADNHAVVTKAAKVAVEMQESVSRTKCQHCGGDLASREVRDNQGRREVVLQCRQCGREVQPAATV